MVMAGRVAGRVVGLVGLAGRKTDLMGLAGPRTDLVVLFEV